MRLALGQRQCSLYILSSQSTISVSIVSLSKEAGCHAPQEGKEECSTVPSLLPSTRWCSVMEYAEKPSFQPAATQPSLLPMGTEASGNQEQSWPGSSSSLQRLECFLFILNTPFLCCETRWRGTRFSFQPFMHGDPSQLPGPVFMWPFLCLLHILSQSH